VLSGFGEEENAARPALEHGAGRTEPKLVREAFPALKKKLFLSLEMTNCHANGGLEISIPRNSRHA
jgi:hypothetical protein